MELTAKFQLGDNGVHIDKLQYSASWPARMYNHRIRIHSEYGLMYNYTWTFFFQ
jgi:hypothetical protein